MGRRNLDDSDEDARRMPPLSAKTRVRLSIRETLVIAAGMAGVIVALLGAAGGYFTASAKLAHVAASQKSTDDRITQFAAAMQSQLANMATRSDLDRIEDRRRDSEDRLRREMQSLCASECGARRR